MLAEINFKFGITVMIIIVHNATIVNENYCSVFVNLVFSGVIYAFESPQNPGAFGALPPVTPTRLCPGPATCKGALHGSV